MQGFREYVMVFVKGLAMGAADVVPGVSGGTIAFITGIYETWVEALSRFNLHAWRLWRTQGFAAMWEYIHGSFLLALLAGILTAILTFARLVRWLPQRAGADLGVFFRAGAGLHLVFAPRGGALGCADVCRSRHRRGARSDYQPAARRCRWRTWFAVYFLRGGTGNLRDDSARHFRRVRAGIARCLRLDSGCPAPLGFSGIKCSNIRSNTAS